MSLLGRHCKSQRVMHRVPSLHHDDRGLVWGAGASIGLGLWATVMIRRPLTQAGREREQAVNGGGVKP